jgi:mRNA interferase YafQ
MLESQESGAFKRDIKRMRRTHDISKLKHVIRMLASGTKLPRKHQDHMLAGEWKGYRDCHISPDWLLIYRVEGNKLYLARTGSHSEMF